MSGIHFDEKWLAEYRQKTGRGPTSEEKPARKGAPEITASEPKPPKYRNRKTEYEGQTFDSQHEAEICRELKLRQAAGEFRAFATQVPFPLPGGARYVADFVTLNNDGTYTVIDAKSEATSRDKTYRLKRRLMRECLGIEIREA